MGGNPMQMLMQLMMGGNNPQAIISNMMKTNPNAQAIMNQMKQSGMSPKQFVQQYAKQNNMDISQMVNMMKNKGIKL